jgi:hypothetical protein
VETHLLSRPKEEIHSQTMRQTFYQTCKRLTVTVMDTKFAKSVLKKKKSIKPEKVQREIAYGLPNPNPLFFFF